VVVTFGSDEFRFLPDKPVVNLLEKLDSIADVVNSILCRLESQTLNDSEEIEAVPIIPSLTYHRIEGTIPTKKADVRSIVCANQRLANHLIRERDAMFTFL
jgi:hypothetical protein